MLLLRSHALAATTQIQTQGCHTSAGDYWCQPWILVLTWITIDAKSCAVVTLRWQEDYQRNFVFALLRYAEGAVNGPPVFGLEGNLILCGTGCNRHDCKDQRKGSCI